MKATGSPAMQWSGLLLMALLLLPEPVLPGPGSLADEPLGPEVGENDFRIAQAVSTRQLTSRQTIRRFKGCAMMPAPQSHKGD